MNNPSLIRKLPNNTVGKDYVIGDLHGCFDLLEQLLEHVCFDKRCDRLFSVGDLIDRGPDSLRCLELLTEPWFYAVQGNHELMMLEFLRPYITNGTLKNMEDLGETGFLEYGGAWVKAYFQADRERMSDEFNRSLAMVRELPIFLVVGSGDARFHVIHGELVRSDYRRPGQPVWLDSDIDFWINGKIIDENTQERIFWGRKLMRSKGCPPVQNGLSITFCGHTVATMPRQVLSHICLDTGAFLSVDSQYEETGEYGLTLFDVKTAHWYRASYGWPGVMEGTHIQSLKWQLPSQQH